MKALPTALLLALISTCSFSQKEPIRFGDAPIEDIRMTVYPSDSAASAVVLCDYGVSTIKFSQNNGFVLEFERITRIKILNKDGLDYGNFEIPLFHDADGREKMTGIKGITYNIENGKFTQTKLTSENIFEEKTTDYWDRIKIAFPNVKEGSVIDLTYTITSDFFTNLVDWQFQSTIPVRYTEYRTYIPEFYNYRRYMQGYIPVTTKSESAAPRTISLSYREQDARNLTGGGQTHYGGVNYQEIQNQWIIENVPAFRDEPFMTARIDFVSRINFELESVKYPGQAIRLMMGSWDQISHKYNQYYSPEIKGNNFLKQTVQELTTGLTTTDQKIAAILSYVKKNVEFESTSHYREKFLTKSLKKVLEEKKGNAAEINLLIASMLEKADIAVSPVLLSTRDHGLVRQLAPISTQFNYVVAAAKLDDKILLLDGTDKFLPSNLIPERCLNGAGLLVGSDSLNWVRLDPRVKSKTTINAVFTLENESQLTGKLSCDFAGYAALGKRRKYLINGEEEYIKDFVRSRLWERKKSEFRNADNLSSPFGETHELVIKENLTTSENMVYIEPYVINRLENNPFVSEDRQYPVDFGAPSEQTFIYELKLPANYKVEEAPKTQIFALPENAAKFVYNVNVMGSVVRITSILSINKAMYTQDEYPGLREFYDRVVAKQSEQIVIKRN